MASVCRAAPGSECVSRNASSAGPARAAGGERMRGEGRKEERISRKDLSDGWQFAMLNNRVQPASVSRPEMDLDNLIEV